MPPEGVVMVPEGHTTSLGCRVSGYLGVDTGIVWHRRNAKFRDGTVLYQGNMIQLENVTEKDSGDYYCTIEDIQGEKKSGKIQVQVFLTNFSY